MLSVNEISAIDCDLYNATCRARHNVRPSDLYFDGAIGLYEAAKATHETFKREFLLEVDLSKEKRLVNISLPSHEGCEARDKSEDAEIGGLCYEPSAGTHGTLVCLRCGGIVATIGYDL
jgi:hypothetical protein